jgi:hypothetical protein
MSRLLETPDAASSFDKLSMYFCASTSAAEFFRTPAADSIAASFASAIAWASDIGLIRKSLL